MTLQRSGVGVGMRVRMENDMDTQVLKKEIWFSRRHGRPLRAKKASEIRFSVFFITKELCIK